MKRLLVIVILMALPVRLVAQMADKEKNAWHTSFGKSDQAIEDVIASSKAISSKTDNQSKEATKKPPTNAESVIGYNNIAWKTPMSEAENIFSSDGFVLQNTTESDAPIDQTTVGYMFYKRWGIPFYYSDYFMEAFNCESGYSPLYGIKPEEKFSINHWQKDKEDVFSVGYKDKYFAHFSSPKASYHQDYVKKLTAKYGTTTATTMNFINDLVTSSFWESKETGIGLILQMRGMGGWTSDSEYLVYFSKDIEKEIKVEVQQAISQYKKAKAEEKNKALKAIQ